MQESPTQLLPFPPQVVYQYVSEPGQANEGGSGTMGTRTLPYSCALVLRVGDTLTWWDGEFSANPGEACPRWVRGSWWHAYIGGRSADSPRKLGAH